MARILELERKYGQYVCPQCTRRIDFARLVSQSKHSLLFQCDCCGSLIKIERTNEMVMKVIEYIL